MVIDQFRKFTPINIVYLSLLGLVLCASVLLRLPDQSGTFLAEPELLAIVNLSEGWQIHPGWNVIITLIITILQALYLNRVMNKYNFTGRPSFLTALMYVTLASLLTPFLVLTSSLISNFMLIWMLDKLIGVHYREKAVSSLYDLGLIVAVGSLIYNPFIGNLLVVWIALLLFRPFQWREWLAPLLGALTVYFLLWVAYFWQGRSDEFSLIWEGVTKWSILPFSPELKEYVVGIPVVIILLLFVGSVSQHLFKRIVLIRKIVQLLVFMLLIILIGIIIDPTRITADLLLLVPILSIYFAFYFYHASKKAFYESIYIFLIFTILAFQFF